MTPSEAVRQQGAACAALDSPMYAALCARIADDLDAGGPVAAVVAGHGHLRGPDALALRLLGAVHRLVLERRAGGLAVFYPSVGGTWEDEAGWAAFRDLLEAEPDTVAAGLDLPQTNEVGRVAALLGGLLHLPDACRRPLRLHEIGASGGLLLRPDHVRCTSPDGFAAGPADAALVLADAWTGRLAGLRPWPDLEVVERRGCDLAPVDPTTTAGRTTLAAYTWPDQPERWERLRAALALAAAVPATVEAADAADLADDIELVDGTTTVLWHAVVEQYLPAQTAARVERRVAELLEAATPDAPFVHLALEPRRRGDDRPLTVTLRAAWGAGRDHRDLGTAAPHGVPVRWG
ncbi:hypothetical protein QE364_001411 [Nocardioides zeae]|uniref:DUF2332 domain-containing protein n=2 Tax=Nocardioides zeae TaxID=1457234 RepID=A0AAJ1X0X2_9ACTN|nr:DUF2332 domain-containing protein [Nocardioides zeae]MDQ1103579.1 hypothetical protein [Nocardioides zeae]MDR6176699.1 hypothetical protein [Nocardioides zeae]MDR6209711.1 hypothetical protein [Nocardioides zeae]